MKKFAISMACCVFLLGCSGAPRDIEERPEPPLHPIFTRSEAELQTAAGTVDFVGMQTATKMVPLIISTRGFEPPPLLFHGPRHLAAVGDGNGIMFNRVYVTPAEFSRILGAIRPFAQKATAPEDHLILACTFVRVNDDSREAIEFEVLETDYADFSQAIFNALDDDNSGRNTIIGDHSCLASWELKKRGARFRWSTR